MDETDILSVQVAATVVADSSKNNETQVTYIITILTLGCAFSTIAVVLRLYTRLFILHTFGADDATMAFAQLLTLASGATIYLETAYGLGRHTWMMLPENLVPYLKSFFSSIIVYNVATCILKLSILLQIRRIFRSPLMQKLALAVLIFECLWALVLSILLPLVCTPVAAFWDSSIKGKCVNQLAVWYVMAAVNLATDFIVFSMPLPAIKSLQIPKKQKLMLMGVFCLGFFTCIISVYRITTLEAAADSTDPTWENTGAAIWSLIELSIGVLAACLPTLKPLFALALPRLFKSTLSGPSARGTYGGGGGGGGHSLSHTASRHQFPHQLRSSKSSKALSAYKGIVGKNATIQDVDGDMEALRTDGSFGSVGKDMIEMPRYQVSVSGGRDRTTSRNPSVSSEVPSLSGIQLKTVVTQRVDSL